MPSYIVRLLVLLTPLWLRNYRPHYTSGVGNNITTGQKLSLDITAGVVMGVVVIPQSLGYALLAGLPPVYGLYASIVPALAYAYFGASPVQAIGPVAITSVMVAQALLPFAALPIAHYASYAALLAAFTGITLVIAGYLKLGGLTQFMSQGVMAGFISGTAIIIALAQAAHILGWQLSGATVFAYIDNLVNNLGNTNVFSCVVGGGFAITFILVKRYLRPWLCTTHLHRLSINILANLAPVVIIAAAILLSKAFNWQANLAVVGYIGQGLPGFVLPTFPSSTVLQQLATSAGFIAFVAFVSTSAVSRSYALNNHISYNPNQELKGLGAANIIGALFKGFPVAGGFSRTAVNVDAGALSPLAGMVAAGIIVVILLGFTTVFYHLPVTVLAAGIMVSVLRMVDVALFKRAWRSDRADAWAFVATTLGVLCIGLFAGLIAGLIISLGLLIARSSQPHIALVGKVANSEHYRNINRHQTLTWPHILLIRIDENLFFGNTHNVSARIYAEVANHKPTLHVVLILHACNYIDLSAQTMLQSLNQQLNQQGVLLHLAEVKGPVMDNIQKGDLLNALTGQVFMRTEDAVQSCLRSTV